MRKFLLNENHKSRKLLTSVTLATLKIPNFFGKLAVAKLVMVCYFHSFENSKVLACSESEAKPRTSNHRSPGGEALTEPCSNASIKSHFNERAPNPSFNPLYASNCLAAASYLVGCRSSLVLIHLLNLSCAGSN